VTKSKIVEPGSGRHQQERKELTGKCKGKECGQKEEIEDCFNPIGPYGMAMMPRAFFFLAGYLMRLSVSRLWFQVVG
jgi:hypothetical protein